MSDALRFITLAVPGPGGGFTSLPGGPIDALRFITLAVAGFITVFQSEVFDNGRRKGSLYLLLDLGGMALIVLSGKIIQLTRSVSPSR